MTAGGRHAILCGISTYVGARPLPAISKELDDLEQTLLHRLHPTCRYDKATVRRDSELTLRGIRALLTAAARPSTTLELFVYFAGHGLTIRDRSYFMTSDIATDPIGIPVDEIVGMVADIPVQTKFLVLDFCHSGAAWPEVAASQIREPIVDPRRIAPDSSMALLAACAAEHAASDGLMTPSMTRHLIAAFTSSARAISGEVTWSDIVAYVEKAMERSVISRPVSFDGVLRTHVVNKFDVSPHRLAILPFEASDPSDQRRAVDFSRELHRSLAGGVVPLIGWSSVSEYEPPFDSNEIARAVGADRVVRGTLVRRTRDNFVIDVEVLDVPSSVAVFAQQYKAGLGGLSATQLRMSREIIATLRPPISDRRRTPHASRSRTKPPVQSTDADARALVRTARSAWYLRTRAKLEEAIQLFEKARSEDPSDPLPHAGLADCYSLMGSYGYEFLNPRAAEEAALRSAIEAVRCNEESADAHTALAAIYHDYGHSFRKAELEYSTAIRLNSHYPSARQWYGILLMQQGRIDEAIRQFAQAETLDGSSSIVLANVALARWVAGDAETAIASLRRIVECDPSFAIGHCLLSHCYLSTAAYGAAKDAAAAALDTDSEVAFFVSSFGCAAAQAGDTATAAGALDRLDALQASSYVSSFHRGLVLLGLGHTSEAIRFFGIAAQEESPWRVWYRMHPTLRAAREHSAFGAILDSIGRSW